VALVLAQGLLALAGQFLGMLTNNNLPN